jgi:hypothetical protein
MWNKWNTYGEIHWRIVLLCINCLSILCKTITSNLTSSSRATVQILYINSCTSHAILGPLRARHSSAPSFVRCGPYLMLMEEHEWLCLQSSRLISTFVWTSGISSTIRCWFHVCWNFRHGSCVLNSSDLQSRIHITIRCWFHVCWNFRLSSCVFNSSDL